MLSNKMRQLFFNFLKVLMLFGKCLSHLVKVILRKVEMLENTAVTEWEGGYVDSSLQR